MKRVMTSVSIHCAALALVASLVPVTSHSALAKTYRLAATSQPGSEDVIDAKKFADTVRDATEGRVDIRVYPSSQLGDYTQVFESMSRGGIDMALQAVPSSADKRMSLLTFPMAINGYDSAKKAYAPGGYMFDLVDQVVSSHNVKLLGAWARGMAGAAFAGPVKNATEPNAKHDQKIRVWPGGRTHYALVRRLGYNPATVPWAELYTAMQTGVVDGYVGSTATTALDNFGDVVKTWVPLQDHFTMAFFIMNKKAWEGLKSDDQQAIIDAARKIDQARFEAVRKADEEAVKKLKEKGVTIVSFTPEQRAKMIKVVREDVWPELEDTIGKDLLQGLMQATETPEAKN